MRMSDEDWQKVIDVNMTSTATRANPAARNDETSPWPHRQYRLRRVTGRASVTMSLQKLA